MVCPTPSHAMVQWRLVGDGYTQTFCSAYLLFGGLNLPYVLLRLISPGIILSSSSPSQSLQAPHKRMVEEETQPSGTSKNSENNTIKDFADDGVPSGEFPAKSTVLNSDVVDTDSTKLFFPPAR